MQSRVALGAAYACRNAAEGWCISGLVPVPADDRRQQQTVGKVASISVVMMTIVTVVMVVLLAHLVC